MWIIYTLASVIAFLCIAVFAIGFVAHNMTLVRPKEKKPSINKKTSDEAQRQSDLYMKAVEENAAWFLAQNPEEVQIAASQDNTALRGYYLPAKEKSSKLVVFSHGYTAHSLREFAAFFSYYHEELGFHILTVDHRSHGRSDGKYIGFSALEWQDILDWANTFAGRLGDNPQVVLHGMSMGAATVLNLNANNPPDYIKCMVADCGFTNGFEIQWLCARRDLGMPKIAKPVLWASALWFRIFTGKSLRRDADPFGNASKFVRPTLFVCGEDDPFVPCEMTERNYAAATCEKELFLVPGAHHVMAYYLDKEGYQAKLSAWFAQWIKEDAKV